MKNEPLPQGNKPMASCHSAQRLYLFLEKRAGWFADTLKLLICLYMR